MILERNKLVGQLRSALQRSKVVALLGPRQCGKTTLARRFVDASSPNYFDLEDPAALAMLEEPMTALRELMGVVVLDEVQRRPEIFPVLRVLADRTPLTARFLVLWSASPELLRQSSESLAGRIEIIEMSGFSLADVGIGEQRKHWLRGGLPPAYLAKSDDDSFLWRKQFVRTLLEHDLPQLGISSSSLTLLRFWTMLAHYHGQGWNAAEPARALGVSQQTTRRYLDVLTGVFMIRQLQPWHGNVKKRQVKTSKVYFRDSGLLHQLLGIRTMNALFDHPKIGASWEGYVIEQILEAVAPDEAYFWATHGGAEIDLVMQQDGRLYGVECKRADAPRMTPSMRVALEDIGLERITVVYPGERRYRLADQVEVVPLHELSAGTLLPASSGWQVGSRKYSG